MPVPLFATRVVRRLRSVWVAPPLLLLATIGLADCSGSNLPKFAPACPVAGILRDGADITRFRAGGTDLTDMIVDGRITGLSGKCSLDDLTHLHTVISVSMDLTRGPAALNRQADVTYFISVAKGDTILDKKDYTFNVNFPRNSERLRLTGDQIDLILPINDQLSGPAYSVLVGFQLTPEQLAFNRQRGAR